MRREFSDKASTDAMSPSEIKGPRPMALHLSNALGIWREAPAGAVRFLTGDGAWHPAIADDMAALKACMADPDSHSRFLKAVGAGAGRQAEGFLQGINQYLQHPYVRPESDAVSCLNVGSCELFDFGGDGQPILMVPSLVNPHYVLDLMPGRSLAQYLKQRGFRPFLVKWFDPGEEELSFGLSDFILKRAKPMLEYICALSGAACPVLGYCMGGTLMTGLAARAGDLVSSLALVAAPWDFASEVPHAGRRYAHVMAELLDQLPEGMPVPTDMMQVFFTSVDPTLSDRKFRRFAGLEAQSEEAKFFVALETWANTGAPLARSAAEECIRAWYLENETGRGVWNVGRAPVELEEINCPVWIAAPKKDRLVPQDSAFAMARRLPNATTHDPGAGHVGMMVGSRAERGLWAPLVSWLKNREVARAA